MATINQITVNSTTYDLAVSAANVSGTVANATTATKLGTANKGSATQPIYLSAGAPTACTYSLAKSVPADAKFTDTTYSNFVKSGSGAKAGLVPAPSTTAGTTKYLREDGTWVKPPNTTYSNMGAATSSAAGSAGLVPAPAAGAQAKFLRGDGTWQTPSTSYTLPTASSSTLGGVKVGTGLGISSGTLSVSYGTTATTACKGNDSRLSDSRTPKAHASSATTYGTGTASNYGHVKLSDSYTTSGGAAAAGVAASSYALVTAYNTLNSNLEKNKITLLKRTFVQNITTDSSGHATISIDVSSLNLSNPPITAFLQGQYSSFNEYIYRYDSSTKTVVVFWMDYGIEHANQTITNRFGVLIFP